LGSDPRVREKEGMLVLHNILYHDRECSLGNDRTA
jgi:hypothetical protein